MADREPRLGDVAEIANAIQLAAASDGKGLGRTVFFIGAGCSKSAGIPLVPEMAQQLALRLAKAKKAPATALKDAEEAYRWLSPARGLPDCRVGEVPKDGTADTRTIDWGRVYDILFADHFKTPDHAREIFSDFVDQAGGRINWAHLCLGELAKQKLVSTVITTNFDQLVLAGLVRSGVLPVVCDGLESLTRIRGQPLHPQLIELHGSRHTYRLRNAPDELEALLNDAPTIAAIESLFQDLRVFVAVGYGGREKGVMDLLIRAASRFADKQLFWVAHGSDPARLSDRARALLATSRNSALLVRQDADSFFVRLLKELSIGAPESIREPLFLAGFHASLLASHAIGEVAEAAIIGAEIERHRAEISVMRQALDRHRRNRSATDIAIGRARELRLEGKLSEALAVLESATKRNKDKALWEQLGEVAYDAGQDSPDRKTLETATAAWRYLLKNSDRSSDAPKWARTEVSLGLSLWRLGERESGTPRLEEAVVAFRAALQEYTRERVPLDWAMTQNNLGNALAILGGRESGTTRLEEAVVAYRAALEEHTRERLPLEWATTQNNLGNALQMLGERESGTARLEEAVAAFRAALEEHTRERVPLDWAMTQNNLGNALQTLGGRESGTARLEEAVAAYRAALEEYTRERLPLQWASTQNNLGAALQTLAQREGGPKRLEEAVAAFRAALEERTRERVPLDWAMTQNNLGNALQTLGERESGIGRLAEAIAAYRAALEVFETGGASHYIAIAQRNLARTEALIAERRPTKS